MVRIVKNLKDNLFPCPETTIKDTPEKNTLYSHTHTYYADDDHDLVMMMSSSPKTNEVNPKKQKKYKYKKINKQTIIVFIFNNIPVYLKYTLLIPVYQNKKKAIIIYSPSLKKKGPFKEKNKKFF